MLNPITKRVALETACHEALIRQTYYDSQRVPTWNVGMTDATGHRVDRYWGNPQPLQKCMDLYIWALDNYANAVRRRFEGFALTEAQFAAILSWTWNVGEGWLKDATWIPHFMNGNMKEAERRFLLFRTPPEIIGRRKKEADLLFRGKWSNDGRMAEYTRVTPNKTPDWKSRITINVSNEITKAIQKHTGADPNFVPVSRPEGQGATLTPEAAPKPKPLAKSTTLWATVLQYAGGALTALASLDWKVAVPLIIVGGGLAWWVIRERDKKGREFGV